jgi:hypothetical protein
MHKETDPQSSEVWSELEAIIFSPPDVLEKLAKFGITSDTRERLSRSGIRVEGMYANDFPILRVMPETPAQRLLDLNSTDSTLSETAKLDRWHRFYSDVLFEEDVGRLQYHWPELY